MTKALLRYRLLPCAILVAGLMLTENLYGQRRPAMQSPSNHVIGSAATEKDTVKKGESYVVNDVAKKVDSLQLVLVYNSDLVRNDINNKLIWIYILLGGMVVSNVMMYAAFNQIRKQSQEAEDGLKIQLSELQGKTSAIAKSLEAAESAAGPKPPRKPSRTRPRSGKRS
ncbi:MAG: hypothetical protein WEE20_09610 [Bacteroidota bacterium]